jgi:hypothetical protein
MSRGRRAVGLRAAVAGSVVVASLAVAVPAHAASLTADVFCEPLGRARVLCDVTVVGATAPTTIKWLYNGNYFASMDNRTFTLWGCNPTGTNLYTAMVIDATGASAQDTAGTNCLTGPAPLNHQQSGDQE